MMDQQRPIQNQQQQQRSHHRRPPDVEEALSSMLWTPYERTPTDSSSDDDDERLNRRLRKSQSSYEYYQYGGLTLAPPPPDIMPYFGSNEPISPIVPLPNHQNTFRNHNNNINNNSILSYSGSSHSINNNNINNTNHSGDYFRKTDRCDNFRFSYPYYGPIPSLKKWNLSMEPPSYDSLYSRSRDVTRVLSNLVTVSATAASGVMHTPNSGNRYEQSNATYGRMVHSFTDNFVIECDSSSATSSASSTTSVQQHLYPFCNTNTSSSIVANKCSITIGDVTRFNDEQHKTKNEQKQTEVSQLAAENTSHQRASTIFAAADSCCSEQQQHRVPEENSTALHQRTGGNERIEDRSLTLEPSEVSSLSAFVSNGIVGVARRSNSFTALTTTTATEGLNQNESSGQTPNVHVNAHCFTSELSYDDPPVDKDIITTNVGHCHSNDSAGSVEECLAIAMRLNIPATIGAGANLANSGKCVSVTTSSVFLSNSIVTSTPQSTITNQNNNNGGSSVAIVSGSNAPSLTIQVTDGCSNINNSHSSHGDFVVNQSIANNGISVVNCTYVDSGSGSVNSSSSNNTSSSVPKNDQFSVVNSKPADIQSSKISVLSSDQVRNGLQQPLSPTRTFTSTECQTDDIPMVIRGDGSAAVISPTTIGGNSGFTRTHLHPDALLSREQRRRERRERRHQQQQSQQQQIQHQRLSRHHSHSHPPPQPQLIHHPAHHTMSAAAAAMLRPMLPDILHSHFPPPYSALPLSQGAPPAPPPPPHAASLITPVISTVPIAATATMVGDGRFTIPLPIMRRSPSERSGKGCCGQWFAGPPLRALIAVVALGGVACALGGAALGATGLAGPPSSHLTAALLMIGVGVILVTVSGAAWRMTAPGGPPCLGLGSSVDLGRCGRRPCSRGGGAPHGLLYPEFQHRPPPPSYQASMQEYRLRLLLLDRDRQNGVVRGSSPPPTYRSHAGSLLRAPLTTTIRGGAGSIGGPGSEYSLPPSYRSRNNTPAIIFSERSIETAPSGGLLANEDIPESSLCANLDSSLPEYNAIINESMHQQPQQNSSSRNSQQNSTADNDNRAQHHGESDNSSNIKMGPQKQITSSTLVDGHHSSSTPKEFSSAGERTSLSQINNDTDSTNPRDHLLYLSEKLNPRVLDNGHKAGDNNNRTIGFLNIRSTTTALSPLPSSSQPTDPTTTGKTKDLVTIVTISRQDSTNQLHMQSSPPSSHNEMEILAHL